ncbi:MAG: YdeI/OmpD-associated family protein [Streptosporangiaceae bacterium]
MTAPADPETMRFQARLDEVASSTIMRLPGTASGRLPSRGQVAVEGTINGHLFATVLEPDGLKGHWVRVDQQLQRTVGLRAGDSVTVTIEVARDWPEPVVPSDLAQALASAPEKVRELWGGVTPMARWEWVRWLNATASPSTRQRRVEASISKMNSGKRRPCCFDLSACTDPALSRNGKLLDAT